MGAKQEHRARDAAESPVAWFAELERARTRNDFDRASEAVRELARLGVVVKYRRGRQAVEGAGK
jgi:hypothetical protein